MLRTSDEEYKVTRLIKLGKATMDIKFLDFAKWINKVYSVDILNIWVDKLNENCTRVQLIFDQRSTVDQFFSKDKFTIDAHKKSKISKKYKELFSTDTYPNILLLIYAFEPLAKEEANTKIPLKTIELFKVKYEDLIWEISRFGENVTFFFYTEAQLKERIKSPFLDQLKKEYFEILKPFDTFAYFTYDNFNAVFYSKENFEKKYGGSWRNYYN